MDGYRSADRLGCWDEEVMGVADQSEFCFANGLRVEMFSKLKEILLVMNWFEGCLYLVFKN